ncbi:hypothetical protein ACU4HD_47915, partial [Cupriavidus basilensis]
PKLFEHGWLIASLDSQITRIRSGHLLLALLTEPSLPALAQRGSRLFGQIEADRLKHDFDRLTTGSDEQEQAPWTLVDGGRRQSAKSGKPRLPAATPLLDRSGRPDAIHQRADGPPSSPDRPRCRRSAR